METLIQLLIVVVCFCIIAGGLIWVCRAFALPQFVQWIVGAILLLIILVFLMQMVGGGGTIPTFKV